MKKTTKKQPIHHRSRRLHLARHHHSGRHMPHGMTSYPALVLLVAITGIILLGTTAVARASTQTVSESIGVSATVSGPAPSQAATILEPATNSATTQTPLRVSGSCSPETIVKIYRNETFAGSTFCDALGKFEIFVDLVEGSNTLSAKNFDALDQAGPDSADIIVFYRPVKTQQSTTEVTLQPPETPVAPLTLTTPFNFRGLKPKQQFTWPLTITGGKAPYSLRSDWGDNSDATNQKIEAAGESSVSYAYEKPGRYTIVQIANDASGLQAFLQLAAVVDGYVASPLGTIDVTTDSGEIFLQIQGLMPFYWTVTATVAVFWLAQSVSSGQLASTIAKLTKPGRYR